MVVKQMDDWSTLIGELEHNTPEKVWIVREELNISEVFEIQKIRGAFYFSFRRCLAYGK